MELQEEILQNADTEKLYKDKEIIGIIRYDKFAVVVDIDMT